MKRKLGLLAALFITLGAAPIRLPELHTYTTTLQNSTGESLGMLITHVDYGQESQCNLRERVEGDPTSIVPCRAESMVVTVDDSVPQPADVESNIVTTVTNDGNSALTLLAGHGGIGGLNVCVRSHVDAHATAQVTCSSSSTTDWHMQANNGYQNTKLCDWVINGDQTQYGLRCSLRRVDETHFEFVIDEGR